MKLIEAICNDIEQFNSMIPFVQWVVIVKMMVIPQGHHVDRETKSRFGIFNEKMCTMSW